MQFLEDIKNIKIEDDQNKTYSVVLTLKEFEQLKIKYDTNSFSEGVRRSIKYPSIFVTNNIKNFIESKLGPLEDDDINWDVALKTAIDLT